MIPKVKLETQAKQNYDKMAKSSYMSKLMSQYSMDDEDDFSFFEPISVVKPGVTRMVMDTPNEEIIENLSVVVRGEGVAGSVSLMVLSGNGENLVEGLASIPPHFEDVTNLYDEGDVHRVERDDGNCMDQNLFLEGTPDYRKYGTVDVEEIDVKQCYEIVVSGVRMFLMPKVDMYVKVCSSTQQGVVTNTGYYTLGAYSHRKSRYKPGEIVGVNTTTREVQGVGIAAVGTRVNVRVLTTGFFKEFLKKRMYDRGMERTMQSFAIFKRLFGDDAYRDSIYKRSPYYPALLCLDAIVGRETVLYRDLVLGGSLRTFMFLALIGVSISSEDGLSPIRNMVDVQSFVAAMNRCLGSEEILMRHRKSDMQLYINYPYYMLPRRRFENSFKLFVEQMNSIRLGQVYRDYNCYPL